MYDAPAPETARRRWLEGTGGKRREDTLGALEGVWQTADPRPALAIKHQEIADKEPASWRPVIYYSLVAQA